MAQKYKSDFLNILDERGFLYQCSDYEALDQKLCEGPQSAYIGFDATAKSLHIGNLTGIMMLRWFQECGHKPITLMGGATSKIGDPSFKNTQRKLLDTHTIEDNIKHIQETCFEQFLNYGTNASEAMMVNNDDWFSGIGYIEFIREVGPHLSVGEMIKRDSVKTRLEENGFLSFLELNYQPMQGYDFVKLNRDYGTILQMGGSDQWGNIISGVDLARKLDQKQVFALTAPLLTKPDGTKMGKTENGAVWLNKDMLSPYEYWQYWRNVEDVMVGTLLRRFTLLPIAYIQKLEALQGSEINEAKKILANEATALCHGRDAANDAAQTAEKVFEQGSVGEDLPRVEIAKAKLEEGIAVTQLFNDAGLVTSNGEARRLIKGGGAKINDQKIEDENYTVSGKDITPEGHIKLSAGKKKHVLIIPKP
jgi:tyrosyl-tRNA synthetase